MDTKKYKWIGPKTPVSKEKAKHFKELMAQKLFSNDNLDPKHYNQFKIQVMQFCEENKLGWCQANVIKYVCRAEMKNGVEDLKKAMEYLKCLIYYKETGEKRFLTPDKIKKLKRSWR